jgi:hypothetical protein
MHLSLKSYFRNARRGKVSLPKWIRLCRLRSWLRLNDFRHWSQLNGRYVDGGEVQFEGAGGALRVSGNEGGRVGEGQ